MSEFFGVGFLPSVLRLPLFGLDVDLSHISWRSLRSQVLGRPHDQKKQPVFIIYYNQHVVRDFQYLTKCKMNWFPVKMVL
jgi:hypothetical protein